ncbi:UNKNOWN [Stylonychia lemnae]|uniref:Uncharacterized protein n=1 Tax=Stylonychia lemnae TaxID=5949 RepID=A0A078A9V3_STYLE|nr:UNKNOWN [Stylonychia lemnae]|eukprot:CDW77578.1 UNKNOWN [Stylonychia lemnae]
MGNNIFSSNIHPSDSRENLYPAQRETNNDDQKSDQNEDSSHQPVQEVSSLLDPEQSQAIQNEDSKNNADADQNDWEDESGDYDEDDEEDLDELVQEVEATQSNELTSEVNKQQEEEESKIMKLGCQHYKRGCQKKCPECKEFFTCRFCHDDAKYLNEKDVKKSHQIDRHAVQEIKCLQCGTEQKVQQICESCGLCFAGYFCAICKFFDDEFVKKKIFHCDKCGICRVGGIENNYHCDICGCCYQLAMKDSHNCKPQRLNNDCAVCMEDLFSSRDPSVFLRCGHSLHSKCYSTYIRRNIMCPICRKSIIDPKAFEAQMDMEIASTPMPEEYKDTKIMVQCNDCSAKSEVNFHVLGAKCTQCNSYNTSQIQK